MYLYIYIIVNFAILVKEFTNIIVSETLKKYMWQLIVASSNTWVNIHTLKYNDNHSRDRSFHPFQVPCKGRHDTTIVDNIVINF